MSRSGAVAYGARIHLTRMMIFLVILFMSLGMVNLVVTPPAAQAQPGLELPEVPDPGTWVTDGYVASMATDGNLVYIGGDFSRVGPNVGRGAVFNASSDTPLAPFLRINYEVSASASDGSGGWFIGGYFTGVQGEERYGLAHILADGNLDPAWIPDFDGEVRSLCVDGGTVYITGYFNNVGGQLRRYIAGLDATTGAVTPFNPDPDSNVNCIAASGGTVYAGGYFTQIGGQPRNRIAALDGATGAATAWDPNANSDVYSLAVDGGTVYAGGYFNWIGGQSRQYLAGLDAATGNATAFNPSPNSSVYDIAVNGGTVYAGGYFSWAGGQPRQYLAGLDPATGNATAFNPNPNSNIEALAAAGGTVYASGYFNQVGGQPRNRLAALDGATGAATAWDPDPDDHARTISAAGGKLFVGGYFNTFGGVERRGLAALDASGMPTAWDPGEGGFVQALEYSDGLLYVGGYFGSVGGQPRNCLAAVDASTGAATAWDPDPDEGVQAISVADGTVYAGGEFRSIGGQPRDFLAAVDASTGLATAWDPSPNDYVYDVEASGGLVYAGGEFTSIGGQPRDFLAALDASTGLATSFNPSPDDFVVGVSLHDGLLYAGGFFSSIGGQTRYNVASLATDTGMATAWDPGADMPAISFIPSDGLVYTGGIFSFIGGNSRMGLAAVDAAGNSTAWNPNSIEWYYRYFSSEGEGSSGKSGKAGKATEEDKQAYRDLKRNGVPERGSAEYRAIYFYMQISDLLLAGDTLYACGYFDNIGPYSQGGIAAFTDATNDWYMAEGSTDGGMETWILVENPGAVDVTVDLDFDTGSGQVIPPGLQGLTVPALSRVSFNVGPFITSYDIATHVTAHGGEVVCERALYGSEWSWASSSIGTQAPNSAWYLAEGCTDGGMSTWVLVQNPNDAQVEIDVSFLTGNGEYKPSGLTKYAVPAHSRVSFNAGDYVTDYDLSTKVVSRGGGVVCERSTYGPGSGDEGPGTWATSSMGCKAPSRTWYLAEGATDGGMETWVLVENPYDQPVDVDLQFLSITGNVQGPRETIPGKARRTYNAGDYITAYDVSTVIGSSGAGVICERAFYGSTRSWASTSPGSNVAAMTWDLPEGATDGGMETWLLVFNPNDYPVLADVSFFTGNGEYKPAELQSYGIGAHQRATLRVGQYLTDYDVSTRVAADADVVCERSMYGPNRGAGMGTWSTCSEGAYR